tara:strand:+ start:26 stop:385 length:360 start_codon:yes stop_codon:yes gene_type:complete
MKPKKRFTFVNLASSVFLTGFIVYSVAGCRSAQTYHGYQSSIHVEGQRAEGVSKLLRELNSKDGTGIPGFILRSQYNLNITRIRDRITELEAERDSKMRDDFGHFYRATDLICGFDREN